MCLNVHTPSSGTILIFLFICQLQHQVDAYAVELAVLELDASAWWTGVIALLLPTLGFSTPPPVPKFLAHMNPPFKQPVTPPMARQDFLDSEGSESSDEDEGEMGYGVCFRKTRRRGWRAAVAGLEVGAPPGTRVMLQK